MFSIRDIIIIAVLIPSVPICFMRPVYGAAAWIVLSFISPQFYACGFARQVPLALLIAIPTVLGFLVFSRNWKALLCRETALLFALWLWFTLTTFNSAHVPAFADKTEAAWYRWGLVSKILLMTLVIVGILNTWNRLRWLVLAIAGSFGFLVVKSIPTMILSDGASRVYGPNYSMISDNNDFGLALNMVLPFFFFLAVLEDGRWMKRGMAFVFVVTIPAIIFTYSRGALLGLVAVLFLLILRSRHRIPVIVITLMVGIFAMVVVPQAWRDRMATTAPDALDASARSRINVWKYCWNMTKDYPVMGGGFDAFTPSLFQKYAPDVQDIHGPHSIYFGVMAEHGFVGLALYLALIASCFASLRGLAKTARAMDSPHIVAYSTMFSLSLVGFLTSGAFLGRAYFDFFFTIVGCIAVLRNLSYAEWAEKIEEREAATDDADLPELSDPAPDFSAGRMHDGFAL